jgi:hypothetical protein
MCRFVRCPWDGDSPSRSVRCRNCQEQVKLNSPVRVEGCLPPSSWRRWYRQERISWWTTFGRRSCRVRRRQRVGANCLCRRIQRRRIQLGRRDDDDASGEEDENSDTGLAPSRSPNNSRGHVLDEGTDAARGDRNAAENGSVARRATTGAGTGSSAAATTDPSLAITKRPPLATTVAQLATTPPTGPKTPTSSALALYNPSTNESEDDNSTGLIAAAPMDGSLLRSARGNGNDDDDDRIGNHDVEDEGAGGYGPDGNDDDEAHCTVKNGTSLPLPGS